MQELEAQAGQVIKGKLAPEDEAQLRAMAELRVAHSAALEAEAVALVKQYKGVLMMARPVAAMLRKIAAFNGWQELAKVL